MTALTRSQIQVLKQAAEKWATAHGGAFAHVKYHKQNGYAEGWLATFVTLDGEIRRDVRKVRCYSTGRIYALNERSEVVKYAFDALVRDLCCEDNCHLCRRPLGPKSIRETDCDRGVSIVICDPATCPVYSTL